MIQIRKASPEDVRGIAEVHVASWRSTYKGIVSDTYLSNLSVDSRAKSWVWTFNNLKQDESIFVAVTENNRIVGFSNGGRNRTKEAEYDGELYAIYLLEEYQQRGLGKRLVKEVVNALQIKNYQSMMVWVLEQNPAVEFYKKLGGNPFTRNELQIGEERLVETGIGWGSLDTLNQTIG